MILILANVVLILLIINACYYYAIHKAHLLSLAAEKAAQCEQNLARRIKLAETYEFDQLTIESKLESLEKAFKDLQSVKAPVTVNVPTEAASLRASTRASASPSAAQSTNQWHPWDHFMPPNERRILARQHWRAERVAPSQYPYAVNEAYARDVRPRLVAAELSQANVPHDPYAGFRKRAARDRAYLPAPHAAEYQFDCDEETMQAQSEAIQHRIHRLQNVACDDDSVRVVFFSFDTFAAYGFGAAVRHLAMALDYALSRGRVLVVAEFDQFAYAEREQQFVSVAEALQSKVKWHSSDEHAYSQQYGFLDDRFVEQRNVSASESCGGAWRCYFEPVSRKCTQRSLQAARRSLGSSVLTEENRYEPVVRYSARGMSYDEVLGQLGATRLQDLYWRAQLMRYLFRASDALHWRLLSYRAPPIAMHIRRKDKVSELQGKTLTLDDYTNALHKLKPDAVFVATDSPAVIAQLDAADFEFCYLDENRPAGEAGMFKLLASHQVDRKRQAIDVIENIWMLSQADTLICFVWSKFCALAFELQYARDQHKTKLIDVLNGKWTPF